MMRSKILRIAGLIILVIALSLVLLLRSWSRSGLPVRNGERNLTGLKSEVTVRFDRWGVPHVLAESEVDAAAALGYLHANDRMTQMELGRRTVAGRLSEVLGGSMVSFDHYLRALRLAATAEKILASAEPQTLRLLEAYAAGVNAWLVERGSDLPPALRGLMIEPEPWRPLDSIAFTLLMAEDLSFWQGRPEETRFEWLRAFGEDRLKEILGEPELHIPTEIAEMAAAGTAASQAVSMTPSVPRSGEPLDLASPGSNNWAVGPSRSASDKALLANDPHLHLGLPSIWYQVHLRAPGYEVAGMTLPGAPGVVLGRGPHLAWAFTNTMLDDHDLAFERLDEAGEKYLRDGEWRPLETWEVTIRVRGGKDRTVTLQATDRGPLLPAKESTGMPPRSLSWTAYEPGDSLAALRKLSQARSVEEANAAIASYVCPAQNLMVAFESGEIFYTVLGRVPERRIEDSGEPVKGAGRLPVPGWNPAYGWEGLRPRDSNPTVLAPVADLLVTANHDVRPAAHPLSLVGDFQPYFRFGRIDQRLAESSDWDVASFGELQMDVVSLYAMDLLRQLEADTDGLDGAAQKAWGALAKWDHAMKLHGPSALFALLERRLLEAIFGDEAREADLWPFADRTTLLRLLEGGMSPSWFDDVTTPEVEDRRHMVRQALADAWNDGRDRWGDDVTAWKYGDLHTLTLRHALDEVPLYGRWARRGPYEVPGSSTTVAAFGAVWQGDRLNVTFGPSMRWIIDWGAPEQAWAALPGGQAGHPSDPHYDDRVASFRAGELHPAPWSEEAIGEATVSTLRLTP